MIYKLTNSRVFTFILAKYINDPRNQFPIIIVITLSIYMNYFFLNNEIEGR
jgi:hypothetical protein